MTPGGILPPVLLTTVLSALSASVSVFAPEVERKMEKTEAKSTMGTRIREMRKAAGMSQEQLAEILCTKKATISAYENDHIDIKSSIVLEIAKALNCSGSYLLEGKKAEALDARIMDALLELKNDQMREVALKQIQALALLG